MTTINRNMAVAKQQGQKGHNGSHARRHSITISHNTLIQFLHSRRKIKIYNCTFAKQHDECI